MVYPPFSLAVTGFITGLVLVVLYGLGLWRMELTGRALRAFPRSRPWGVGLLTVVALWAWLLLRWMDLGEFSNLRTILLIVVPVGYVLTLLYVEDFLSVRALGMLLLLLAEPLLEAAFLKPQTSRLLLVVLAYLMIVKGMFMVGMPYIFRDLAERWTRSPGRMRGALLAGITYGAVLILMSLTQYR